MLTNLVALGIIGLASCNADTALSIRRVQEEDFPAIKALGSKAFIKAYNLVSEEQIEALQKSYNATVDADKNKIAVQNDFAAPPEEDKELIALVAMDNDKVIGYLSAIMTEVPSQVYGRSLAIDPDYQKHGISTMLVRHCKTLLPALTSAVCLTSKNNLNAQKFYEHLGGKKVENPAWLPYLYSNLNPTDFVGYEFDQSTLIKFDDVR